MLQDTIADMLTRVRNALMVGHLETSMHASKIKIELARILKNEGYLDDYAVKGEVKKELVLKLKYYQGKPVINKIKRVSKPSRRIYATHKQILANWNVLNGLGIAIISTSKGVLTNKDASKLKEGGEVLCLVC